MTRPSWHQFFLGIARQASTRATCPRKSVGAVIVRDNNTVATGYNGSVAGAPHCTEVGCLMVDGHCVRTVHAEVNAIAQAAKNGVSIDGATVYTTAKPCWSCYKALSNAGIVEIYFEEQYGPEYPDALNCWAGAYLEKVIDE